MCDILGVYSDLSDEMMTINQVACVACVETYKQKMHVTRSD